MNPKDLELLYMNFMFATYMYILYIHVYFGYCLYLFMQLNTLQHLDFFHNDTFAQINSSGSTKVTATYIYVAIY